MMKLALGTLPDDLIDWSGSADDLATKANELLPSLTGSADESVNERLVRYYVQEGVLNPPDREGREAIFRFRQLIQLIVARLLLRDNWPLRKVAELIREADVDALLALAPGTKPRTRAEEAIAGFRRESRDVRLSMTPRAASLGIPDFMHRAAGTVRSSENDKPGLLQRALDVATGISQRRSALADNLRALGNADGTLERRRTLRLTLTPWCQVELDADKVQSMDETTPEILGAALTQALQEERIKKGEKP